jgi:hypothetical protein
MDLTQSSRSHALSTLLATIVAPNDAFAAIERSASWRWALAITIVFAAVGSLLGTPAARHMLEAMIAAQVASDPRFAGLPADQVAARTRQMVGVALTFANLAWLLAIVYVPLAVALEAAVLFAARAIAGGSATFKQLVALCAHVQFITLGIGSLAVGAILALRPAASFHSQSDLLTAVPSLAWVGGNPKVVAFLSAIGPFQLWATVILALGLIAVARFRPPAAWTAAVALLLLGGGWAAAFAR